MPKGIPNKKYEEQKTETVAHTYTTPQVVTVKEEPKPTPAKVEEKLEPLGPGQKYFEAADGTILIGEADKNQLWYRKGNNGQGCWINPKR